MIIPIRTKEQAIAWRGEGYSAIALIGRHDTQGLADVAGLTQFNRGVGLEDLAEHEATQTDCQTSINTLWHYTRAISWAQGPRHKPRELVFTPNYSSDDPQEGMPRFRRRQGKPVRKITFAGNSETGGHPAPDPLLLFSKMVAVWARRNNFSLTAVAEPRDDQEFDELDEEAMDHYLQWREQLPAQIPIGMTVITHSG